jgi:hypothetical protein
MLASRASCPAYDSFPASETPFLAKSFHLSKPKRLPSQLLLKMALRSLTSLARHFPLPDTFLKHEALSE